MVSHGVQDAYKFSFLRRDDWCGPFNYYRNINLAEAFKTEGQQESKAALPVEVLIIAGNNDPTISVNVISQTTQLVLK